MLYLGIDQHKKRSSFCCLNEKGELVKQGNLLNDPDLIEEFLSDLPKDEITSVLEAGAYWGIMYDTLESIDKIDKISLAHPTKVKAFASAHKKTDKIDAMLLAQLLRRDQIPEVWIQSKELRMLKNITRFRLFLVREKNRIKNRIHDIVSRNHLNTPEVSDLFGNYGRKWLNNVELPEKERVLLNQHMELLEFVEEKIKNMEKFLEKLFKNDEDVKLLRTIPGIGKTLSIVIKLEIGDIKRFAAPGKFYAYTGLIPSIYSSGRINRYGHLVKNSNKFLRWALIEAAHVAKRCSIGFRKLYNKIEYRKSRKTAIIVVGRKLAATLFAMLNNKEKYKESKRAYSPSLEY